MMYRITFFLSLIFLVSACGEDETPPEIVPSPVAACCENDAFDASVGGNSIFIPNVFTPDNDGLNDLFLIMADSDEVIILDFKVKTAIGTTVFSAQNFPAFADAGKWDGTVNGTVTKGIFNYEAEVQAADGSVLLLEGKICSLPCPPAGETEPTFAALDNCLFSTQHDGQGGADENLPSFEELECLE